MNTSKKIVIGLGVAGGALLAAWLFTGNRGKKTKGYLSKKVRDIRQSLGKPAQAEEEADTHYL